MNRIKKIIMKIHIVNDIESFKKLTMDLSDITKMIDRGIEE